MRGRRRAPAAAAAAAVWQRMERLEVLFTGIF